MDREWFDDVLVCIADGHGLQKGELYIAQVVTRRRMRDRVVTTLTVSANLGLFEVLDATAFLRRTRLVAEVMAADGSVRLRSFQNAEELDVWAVYARVPPNRIQDRARNISTNGHHRHRPAWMAGSAGGPARPAVTVATARVGRYRRAGQGRLTVGRDCRVDQRFAMLRTLRRIAATSITPPLVPPRSLVFPSGVTSMRSQ